MGSARAGERAGDDAMLHCVSRSLAVACAEGRRKECGEERKKRQPNGVRVLGEPLPSPFDRATRMDGRRIRSDDWSVSGRNEPRRDCRILARPGREERRAARAAGPCR